MKLLTKEIENALLKSPLYSTEKEKRSKILVKFFTPWSNWTWFVLEGTKEKETGVWTFFGLVDGLEKELGYFTLTELESVKGPYGLKIERDMYFDGKYVDKETNEIVSTSK